MNHYSIIHWAALGVLLLGLSAACDKRTVEPTPPESGPEYWPLAVGQEAHYLLDSITLRSGGSVQDSVRLLVRERLVDTLRTADGQLWYRGERHERPNDTSAWIFRQTFLVGRTPRQALRQEDNLQFTKLVFPVVEGQQWDGHAAFDDQRTIRIGGEQLAIYADWQYRYLEVDQPLTVADQTYPRALTVQAADVDGLLDRRYAREQYAVGLGLVYRELVALSTQCNRCCQGSTAQCLTTDWRARAEAGVVLRQWRISP